MECVGVVACVCGMSSSNRLWIPPTTNNARWQRVADNYRLSRFAERFATQQLLRNTLEITCKAVFPEQRSCEQRISTSSAYLLFLCSPFMISMFMLNQMRFFNIWQNFCEIKKNLWKIMHDANLRHQPKRLCRKGHARPKTNPKPIMGEQNIARPSHCCRGLGLRAWPVELFICGSGVYYCSHPIDECIKFSALGVWGVGCCWHILSWVAGCWHRSWSITSMW